MLDIIILTISVLTILFCEFVIEAFSISIIITRTIALMFILVFIALYFHFISNIFFASMKLPDKIL